MQKNDVLKRLRYILDLGDDQMMDIFKLAELEVNRETLCNWLKNDDDPNYVECEAIELASFLNGLITLKRGKREGEAPKPEKYLSNNIVLKKLSIAFSLRSEEVIEVLSMADFNLSKHELSAFFRKKEHKNYRDCKAQVLRNFLMGLQIKLRPCNN